MSIRLHNGRSTHPLFTIKVHNTWMIKFLFLGLVLISIFGILKSPHLRLILSSNVSQLEEADFSLPTFTIEATTKKTSDKIGNNVIVHQPVADNSNNNNISQPTTNTTQEEPNTSTRVETLALMYPPGLIGGYRNQVMRFTAFCRHAIEEHIPQLLLPSIYFSTTYEKDTNDRIFYPIRMKDVFDVDYWNDYARRTGELPSLVDSIENSDCWSKHHNITNQTDFSPTIQKYSKALDFASPTDETPPMMSELHRDAEFLIPLRRLSLAITSGQAIFKRPRKVGLVPLDLNCQHPKVYGGGKGGSGILWNDFLYKIRNEVNSTVIHSVSQALIPAKQWRNVAHQCIHQGSSSRNVDETMAPYFALHTRVELEMMQHRCGKTMEMNLTKIFYMVDEFIENYNQNTTKEKHVERMFMAVSRLGMEEARGKNHTDLLRLANENLDTLALRMEQGRDPQSDKAAIVECGESWMKQWYSEQDQVSDNYYGTLIPMVMNFYIATEAEVFIGTSGSSWSTDVWTTRFYQGKGYRNFMYTKDGIVPVPNQGLPRPHGNC